MYRIAIALLLTVLFTSAFTGCGGGSAPLPETGDQPAGDQPASDNLTLAPFGPSQMVGGHTTSVLPDQLNVLTGATTEELNAQLARFGISVLSKSGGWAALSLPAGTNLDLAAAELEKEYNIAKAEKVNVLHMPRAYYAADEFVKNASFYPTDPMFTDRFIAPGFDPGAGQWGLFYWFGQQTAMNPMSFQAAWDVSRNPGVAAREVRVAIIDAGWFDYDDWIRGSMTAIVDPDLSGSIAGDGTVTPGFAAAAWEIDSDGDDTTRDFPYRSDGELMLGLLADNIGDGVTTYGNVIYPPIDFAEDGTDEDDFWNEGIAGINPNATYILIKTGQLGGDAWDFTDNEIAAAIDYAAGASADDNGGLWPNGGCEADIILLGMFANGAVGANVSTAIQNARDANALVIAPAGDVVDSAEFDGEGNFTGFGDIPVAIDADPVTPASDPNCIAVSATGFWRDGDLGQITWDSVDYDNVGWGWDHFGSPFTQDYRSVATDWANYNGDIAAVGFGLTYSWHPIYQVGAGTAEDPTRIMPGFNYPLTFGRFGSVYAATYVAGVASIVHQALNEANNAEPTDDDVWQVIADTIQFGPMPGVANNGGLLNAGAAVINAIEGGTLFQPSMYLESIVVSQPPSYVAIESDFEITPTVQLGTAPFTLRVDWDNGEEEVEVPDWVNGDPVTLTDGWDTLGLKGINLEIEDSDGQLVTFALAVHVTARLSVGITAEDVSGTLQLPSGDPAAFNIVSGTSYRWRANPTNIYTGEIDGTPNETTFSWDFDGDGTEDATGVAPAFGYPGAGNYTLQLLVSETVRPDILFTVTVNAS